MKPVCQNCKRELESADFAFCPFCGARLTREGALPAEMQEAFTIAKNTEDPSRKFSLLKELQASCPDCLPIERELLMLGRLPERGRKEVSFRLIKCFLLQIYLEPQEFSAPERDEMRREIFHHPQLKHCLSLTDHPASFMKSYLEELSAEFIQIFMEGSNLYMRSLLGFANHRNAHRLLAPHAARVLANIEEDENLTPEEKTLLLNAFYRAFSQRMQGQTAALDLHLAKAGIILPGE